MRTTVNSEFLLCFPPGRGDSVNSGAAWPERHSWVIGWGKDGKGEEHKGWIRVGMGMLASLCSELQQASEGEWITPPVHLWMDQCLMGWWQPRAAGKLASVEGRQGWLIDQPMQLEKNKPHPCSLPLPGFFFLPSLWGLPPCPPPLRPRVPVNSCEIS